MLDRVVADRRSPGEWRVEAIHPPEGEDDVTTFTGPDSEIRARDYADRLNGLETSPPPSHLRLVASRALSVAEQASGLADEGHALGGSSPDHLLQVAVNALAVAVEALKADRAGRPGR